METKAKANNRHQNNDMIRISDLLGMFIPKWYWFVLSIAVALFIAVIYIKKTTPLYTRSAAINIKNTDKNGGSASATGELQDLGVLKNNTNINNELITLQSPTLMTDVVKRLKLDDTYTIEDGMRTKELYKDTPVLVTFKNPEKAVGASFTIQFKGKGKVMLSDFAGGLPVNKSMDVNIGKTVSTPVGVLTLTATPEYSDAWNGVPVVFAKSDINSVANHYTGALRAELTNEDATVISLSIDDPSPKKAEDVLNELINVYNEKWIQDKNQIAVSTSHFIDDRIGVIEGELGSVDNNISSYKSKHLLPDVQTAASQYMTMSSDNKKELLTLNSQLSTAQYIRKELSKQNSTQPLPTNSGIDNINLQGQISEYNTMLLDRNRLLANSSEGNPLVQDLAKSLHTLRTSIMQSVDNVIASINLQIRGLRTQESATVTQLASNPQQAKHLLSVERQQKVKEGLYLFLLQEREQNELNQAFTAYNTRVITYPRGSNYPTSPRKSNILLVAFAIGLFLPAGIIFIKEKSDTRVRGRKDIESLSVPFVGEIPLAKVGNERKRQFKAIFDKASRNIEESPIVVKEKDRDIINEAFRVVRTNLEFMVGANKSHNVIMSTSANPGSGKTFVTINLAVSMAIKEKKVLVIDLDMRKASLSHFIGSPKLGASNYLDGQVDDVKDIIVHGTNLKTLDMIPVGTIPPNPTELLFTKKLEDMITTVKGDYDYVFIDCPPIDVVADTTIIGKLADMTLFIIRAGMLEREMLPQIEELYTEKKYNNMAVLLNGTDGAYGGRYGYHHYGYRYGYHYGYHYGYNYSYGTNGKKKKGKTISW